MLLKLVTKSFIFLVLVVKLGFALQSCNSTWGPPGGVICEIFAWYSDTYQWATCLSNEYIMKKSNNRHYCAGADFCWYQCMLETYDEDYGPAHGVCSCSPDDVYNVTKPAIDDECYTPSGTDCDWYRNCLNKRYNCSGDENYAIDYAVFFCNEYSKNYNSFTDYGKKWVDAVRKCLQVQLAPTLRPWANYTCGQLKQFAFDTHAPCYLKPTEDDSISICHFGFKDWWNTFLTIKRSFCMNFMESFYGILDVSLGCIFNFFENTNSIPFNSYRFIFILVAKTKGRKDIDYNQISIDFENSLSSQMQWDKRQLDWFTFVDEKNTNESEIHVNVWLFSLNEMNSSILANESKVLANADENLKSFFSLGKIRLAIQVGNMPVNCSAMAHCVDDSLCVKETPEIKPGNLINIINRGNKLKNFNSTSFYLIGLYLFIYFLNSLN